MWVSPAIDPVVVSLPVMWVSPAIDPTHRLPSRSASTERTERLGSLPRPQDVVDLARLGGHAAP